MLSILVTSKILLEGKELKQARLAMCTNVSEVLLPRVLLFACVWTQTYSIQHFPKRQILDSSKLKKLADGNFEFDENGRKFSRWVENTVGKGEIAYHEQFLLYPLCFLKTSTADT